MTPKLTKPQKNSTRKSSMAAILKENCGPYAGKTVREVKDILISDFKKMGVADSMYDLI